MILPNAHIAIVDQNKVTNYLLAFDHPEGAGKAVFFRHFGFTVGEWQILAKTLIKHAQSHPVASISDTEHGTKYRVEGRIECPDGRFPTIRAVWIVDIGSEVPRLVTAYPL